MDKKSVPPTDAVAQSVEGGKEKAAEFLRLSWGDEKAESFMSKWDEKEFTRRFSELEKFSVQDFCQVLQKEGEQTIALVLSKLSSAYSAKVLCGLLPSLRANVARRIASLSEVSPQALQLTFLKLEEKLKSLQESQGLPSGGEEHLRKILRHLDAQSEERLLQAIDEEDSDMAERLQSQLYVFEELLFLDSKEIRLLVQALPDKNVWAAALKGSGANLQRHVLGALSINRSSDIVEKMQELEGLPLQEIEKRRKEILQKVKELENENQILVYKDF